MLQVASRAHKHKDAVFSTLQDLEARLLGARRHRRLPGAGGVAAHQRPALETEAAWLQAHLNMHRCAPRSMQAILCTHKKKQLWKMVEAGMMRREPPKNCVYCVNGGLFSSNEQDEHTLLAHDLCMSWREDA